jgi:hypothetical protein
VFAALTAVMVVWGGAAAATSGSTIAAKSPQLSGAWEFGDEARGANISECPQAGIDDQSLRRTERDAVERLSDRGNDVRLNQDYACMPQDEMSIAVNPTDTDNVFGGANDYRLGWGSSGFYVTSDRFGVGGHGHGDDDGPGRHDDDDRDGGSIYDGITAFPTPGPHPVGSPDDHIDGGGDPIAIFDRAGIAYYGQIHFERENDTNGIFVNRSTNGGFTWSRPCVALEGPPRCGGNGDPRHPGDGIVSFFPDNDRILNGSVPFEDKPYGTAGPRPAGVDPQCFDHNHAPAPCAPGTVGVDRIYITWTRFDDASEIFMSFSDDEARSWSPAEVINGSAAFCVGGVRGCSNNQGSQPLVQPTNGTLYVVFENFNTPDENQYVLVRSNDGGATFQGPFFITPVFDVNYPTSGANNRPDCQARGQQNGRSVLTNSCFRVNARGAFIVDKRGGAFADDLYLVIADNRNGTRVSSNTDVLGFKSTNGGTIWTGPTRVNTDPSTSPANRNCGRPGRDPCPTDVHTGNDQWFPWLDISERGWLHGVWQDRRLDTSSPVGVGEWPSSKTRRGNYLAWFWGGRCRLTQTGPVTQSSGRQCVHPGAPIITQPQGPVDPPDDYLDPAQSQFPFRNFGISDTPYNWDYCFRAGIFCGDYENVFVDTDNNVWAMWTDARNGRSSRTQTGRNPACEQSDAWADTYDDDEDADGQDSARSSDSRFWVTPCPISEDD